MPVQVESLVARLQNAQPNAPERLTVLNLLQTLSKQDPDQCGKHALPVVLAMLHDGGPVEEFQEVFDCLITSRNTHIFPLSSLHTSFILFTSLHFASPPPCIDFGSGVSLGAIDRSTLILFLSLLFVASTIDEGALGC